MTNERLHEYLILGAAVATFILGLVFVFWLDRGVEKKEHSQAEADLYRDLYSVNAISLLIVVILTELTKP